ncbi:Type II secretion system (T2SS)-associated protein Gcp8 [Andalucia godoyi]|uniref:Type II secretion system (T2SS)-associated protein Gcp8 n=1 Tax=Andalucia godoyi TaxID=505711 RepID=A0A8K0F2H3_ANDGO|nr:Type II secretion system (T2SS)-associated protein Gcp8 [Andalucia godoyi]|eukprot:ANDGO_08769.mRNA.1 Type II secretion system (T2SS)-associated protein Gcp8
MDSSSLSDVIQRRSRGLTSIPSNPGSSKATLALLLESGVSTISAYASLVCLPVPSSASALSFSKSLLRFPSNAPQSDESESKGRSEKKEKNGKNGKGKKEDTFFNDAWYVVEMHQTSLQESSQACVRNRAVSVLYR